MDEDFAPVDLVSPKGRPWVARTPAELINLTSKGYRRAEPQPVADPDSWVPPTPALLDTGLLDADPVEHVSGDLPATD